MGGGGSTYDYGFRIYNALLGRFLSVDPLTKSYPFYTPYQFAGNKPIWAIDLDGLEEYKMTEVEGKKVLTINAKYGIITEGDNALKNPDFKQINDDLKEKWGGVHEVELSKRIAKKLGIEKNKDGKRIISVQFNIEVVDIKDGANFDVSGTNNPNAGIISKRSQEETNKNNKEKVKDAPAAAQNLWGMERGEYSDEIFLNKEYILNEKGNDLLNSLKMNKYLNNGQTPPIDFNNNLSSVISHEIGHDLQIDDHNVKQGVGSRDNRGSNSNVTPDEVGGMVNSALNSNRIQKIN
jgi:hypothetical protein